MTTLPFWIAAGWTMFYFVWVGTAIGVVAVLARRALAIADPEYRYAVALITLLTLTIAPILTISS